MVSITTLMPKTSIEFPQEVQSVILFDQTAFSHLLQEYFCEHKVDLHLITDFDQIDEYLSDSPSQLVLLGQEALLSLNLSKLHHASLIALLDTDHELDFALETKVLQCDGFFYREDQALNTLSLLVKQALQRKREKRKCARLFDECEMYKEQYLKELKGKSDFINQLSSKMHVAMDQLVQFSHMGLNRMQRKQFTQGSHYLAEIKMIAEEISGYVHDLNEVALLKAGESRFQIEEVDVIECFKETRRQFQPIADSRDFKLYIQTQLSNPYVKGDLKKLTKVLNIMVRNLFKSLPENGFIRLHGRAIENQFQIFIEDSSWMDSDLNEPTNCAVFTPQEFLENTNLKGFGLFICEELMKGQNGTIKIEQDPKSKGVRIALTLPLAGNLFDELTS